MLIVLRLLHKSLICHWADLQRAHTSSGVYSAEYVAAVYSEIRADEVASEVPHSYTTARTLLSILRLSQALARLRFADHVDQVSLQCCVTQFMYQCSLYM